MVVSTEEKSKAERVSKVAVLDLWQDKTLLRRDYLSKEMKLVRRKGRQMAKGKAFQAEGRTSTDAQRHEIFG